MTTTDANMGAGNDTSDPLIGQTIADGKYRIVKVLGEGGMGKVYMGVQKLGDRERSVAIKTLQPELAQDPQIVARFHREAGTVSLLEHPNTIKFYESGQLPDGKLFVAMEYIQGESLAHVIARGPLSPQRVEHILAQVCGSLAEAHEHGIVHRDLKPENIILMQRGQRGDFVKVLDFGIAKRNEGEEDAQHAKLTRQGMVLGTPPYMSPEQFTGKPLRPTSDIYSLAIVAYEMMTGQLPFQAQTPWEWATRHLTAQPVPFESHPTAMNNPQHQKTAVMRALSKDPGARPQTMTQFLQEFSNNASAGNDWSASTSSNAFASSQGGAPQAFAPTPVPMGVPTPQPFHTPAPNTGHGIAPTMAVGFSSTPQPFQSTPQPYQSGPQPFQATSNPGFVPAPTGSGLPAVQQPPSNPGFAPVQAPPYNPYTSQPGGFQNHQQPQQGGGMGKFIAIGAGLLVVAAIGIGVVVSSNNSNDNNNNNSGNNNNGNNNSGNNTGNNTGNNNQPVNNQVLQPIPTPPDPNQLQPIPTPNNGQLQPIPTPNNGQLQPIPTPPPPPPPPPPPNPNTGRPSVCRGGASRIDDLILGGNCAGAQRLYRSMRSAGCLPSGADQSFGTACPRP